ncbi:hypothetical protein GGF50DRAFT_114652 [Schizophyllum commune]
MHPALQIPELLELMISHISDEPALSAPARKTLCALARTCTAFLQPALALLWAWIVTLEPFILLLPEGKRWRDRETFLTTVSSLTPSDIARMRLYAPLIRDLDLRNSSSSFEIDGASVGRVVRALCSGRGMEGGPSSDGHSSSSDDHSGIFSSDDHSGPFSSGGHPGLFSSTGDSSELKCNCVKLKCNCVKLKCNCVKLESNTISSPTSKHSPSSPDTQTSSPRSSRPPSPSSS